MSKKLLTLFAAVASITAAPLFADGEEAATVSLDSQYAIARMQNIQSKPFFSSDLTLSPQIRNLAAATGTVGFVKASKKDVYVGRFNYLGNKISVTKYEKLADSTQRTKRAINQNPVAVQNNLFAVKTEEYELAFNSSTQCVRKGIGARNSLPAGESAARLLRATTNPADMTPLGMIDLYQACIPTWIQAESAQDVVELQQWLMDELLIRDINPANVETIAKPVAIYTLKNDLILSSFGSDVDGGIWASVRSTFNVTTFHDSDLRKLIWDAHKDLVDARKGAKDKGIDINPSLLEGLFADLEKDSEFFNINNMVRKVFKGLYEKWEKFGVPALVILGTYSAAKYAWRHFNDSDRKDVIAGGRKKAIEARVAEQIKKNAKVTDSALLKDSNLWK